MGWFNGVVVVLVILTVFVGYLPGLVRRAVVRRRARRSTWADLEKAVKELAVVGEGLLRPALYPFASLDVIADLLIAHGLYPVRPDDRDLRSGVVTVRRIIAGADA